MRRVLTALVVAAAMAFCGWSTWSYQQNTHSSSVRFAKARDEVQRAGRQELATLNTLDPQQSQAGLDRWLDASTGALHDELRRTSSENRQKAAQARTPAEGTVTDLAVTELNNRAGSAQVIATVNVRLGTTGVERKRFTAALARTGDGWKLSSLTALPIGAE